jgi:hypothetical protein
MLLDVPGFGGHSLVDDRVVAEPSSYGGTLVRLDRPNGSAIGSLSGYRRLTHGWDGVDVIDLPSETAI